MRLWPLLVLSLGFVGTATAGERCIAIDGDTLVCNRQKFRLTNVYAAEMNEAGGAAAKRRLQSLVAGHEVELKRLGHDRYGRVLAEAYVGGRRIEQADIGPRAGRGSRVAAERHEAFPGGSSVPLARPVR
jgi:endonuclease YncB( thermonuclease family)